MLRYYRILGDWDGHDEMMMKDEWESQLQYCSPYIGAMIHGHGYLCGCALSIGPRPLTQCDVEAFVS